MEVLPWSDKSLGAVWTPGLQFPCHPLTSEGTMKWGSDRGPGREEMDSSKKRWMGWGGDRLSGPQSEGPLATALPILLLFLQESGPPQLVPSLQTCLPLLYGQHLLWPLTKGRHPQALGLHILPKILIFKISEKSCLIMGPLLLEVLESNGTLDDYCSFLFSLQSPLYNFSLSHENNFYELFLIDILKWLYLRGIHIKAGRSVPEW